MIFNMKRQLERKSFPDVVALDVLDAPMTIATAKKITRSWICHFMEISPPCNEIIGT